MEGQMANTLDAVPCLPLPVDIRNLVNNILLAHPAPNLVCVCANLRNELASQLTAQVPDDSQGWQTCKLRTAIYIRPRTTW
jgi:hypothetical protein